MATKGQDDKSFIGEPKPRGSISPTGPIGTGPKSKTVQNRAEEILQAEIIVEWEANLSPPDPTEVPLFKTESDGSPPRSRLIPSGTRPKQTGSQSVVPETAPGLPIRNPATTTLQDTEPKLVALEHTDQVSTELQPPLAVLAIAFLVLMFLL
jgi:hypothetical protein